MYTLLTDMVIFDSPYGVLDEDWDEQMTADDIETLLKQVDCVNASANYVFSVWHKPEDAKMWSHVLVERGFKNLSHFFWHKTAHYTPQNVRSYTNSVEMGTLAVAGNVQRVGWNMDKDPRKRHNFIEHPPVTKCHVDADNAIINPCQKPPAVNQWLISNHCGTGSTVLNIGSGAGGEVFGALIAGCNVVGVEKDERQFRALQSVIVNVADQYAKVKPDVPDTLQALRDVIEGKTTDKVNDDDAEGSGYKAGMKCDDCGEVITDEDFDADRVCAQCVINGTSYAPLHLACCEVIDGKFCCPAHQKTEETIPDSQPIPGPPPQESASY